MMDFDSVDTRIDALGEAKIDSPLLKSGQTWAGDVFVDEENRVLIHVNEKHIQRMMDEGKRPPAFEMAGPRRTIYFDPSKVRCALVTCGGLCPGLNDIIRSIVLELYHRYGVKKIYGIKYGLQGFIPEYGHDVVDFTPDVVGDIIRKGGSFLGSSRGPQDVGAIVDCLERMNIGILFMVGGDGTLMAASEISVHEIMVPRAKMTVLPADADFEKVEDYLGIDNLYDSVNTPLISFMNNAIKAKELFKRDKDYVIMDGEVLIVDEHTGRTLIGRRYNEGLHQALEAKEGVEIKDEYQTLATITLQNYFRMYTKLAGMTGTADTEAEEFAKIYNLDVRVVPTNRQMIRKDLEDVVYKTER